MAKVAVIGCGDVAVVHLEAIADLPDAELVAVCDTDPERLAATGARWKVPGFSDHRDLLGSGLADVVHVCTPHDQHADVTVDALEAGVPVLLEKPLAHAVVAGERIIVASATTQTKIGICFQNRYNATSRALRELLDSGRLGQLRGASGTVLWHRTDAYYRHRPWRRRWETAGGGVLINQAIHTLDLVQWLLGDVVGVSGRAARRLAIDGVEVEDTADLVLEHASGVRSVVFATNAHATDAPVALEISTAEAELFVRGDLVVSWADGRREVVPEPRAASGGRSYWGVSHRLLIADFYDRLADPEPFWIGPSEAMKTLRLIDQVYALSRDAEGQLPATAGR